MWTGVFPARIEGCSPGDLSPRTTKQSTSYKTGKERELIYALLTVPIEENVYPQRSKGNVAR